MSKSISKVVQSRAVHGGHTIEIELGFGDGSQEVISCPYHLLANVAQAVRQAGVAAEQAQKAQPGQPIQLEQPYRANGCNAGTAISPDGQWIAIRFSTADAVPVSVAMKPELAQVAIELLKRELSRLGTQSSPHLS
jgi:hypothetical protein